NPDLEGGVAEAIAERIKRLGGVEQIAAPSGRLVIVEDRQLTDVARDRNRQLAARIITAEQHVGQRMAGLLAKIPALQQRGRALGQIVDRKRAAVEQDYDRRLAKREYRLCEVVLLAEEIEAVAVAEVRVGPAFATGLLVSAQDHHDDVGLARSLHRRGDQLAVDRGGRKPDLIARPAMAFGDPDSFG